MKKVFALLLLSLALILFSRWAGKYGVAYSLRDIPPEGRGFALDVTMIREGWWLAEYGSLALAAVTLLGTAGLHFYVRRRN